MKKLPFLILFLLNSWLTFSQEIKPIVIKKTFLGGEIYKYNDKKVSFKKLSKIMEDNEGALTELKIAKKKGIISNVIAAPGTILTILTLNLRIF